MRNGGVDDNDNSDDDGALAVRAAGVVVAPAPSVPSQLARKAGEA
jgi:hypothetical protein